MSTDTYPDNFVSQPIITAFDEAHMSGDILQRVCHKLSFDAGWWKHPTNGIDLVPVVRGNSYFAGALVAQKLCLIHSEVSEAMEGHRKGLMDDKLPHRSMIEVELADAAIRIFDLAGALDLDIGGAISEKLAYNAQRADHKPEHRNAEGGKKY